ncbi:hypothetical protein GOP47_0030804 [Adiantum capillus-veneris]|nr:hypothetical protein GOP47_0030804 [Adiantum capillus-veneris]
MQPGALTPLLNTIILRLRIFSADFEGGDEMIEEENRRPLEPELSLTVQQKSWISSIIPGIKQTTAKLLHIFSLLALDLKEAASAAELRILRVPEEAPLEERVEAILKI